MRVKAMEWWYFLDDLMKDILTEQYYGKGRKFSYLTGREIEFIFKNEVEL